LSQKRQFLQFFGENIFKIITSVPGHLQLNKVARNSALLLLFSVIAQSKRSQIGRQFAPNLVTLLRHRRGNEILGMRKFWSEHEEPKTKKIKIRKKKLFFESHMPNPFQRTRIY
jgi:hypothetical protein